MKEIPLSTRKNGKNLGKYIALVDDEDYEEISKYNWTAQSDLNTYYAIRKFRLPNGKQGTIKMHRQIMKVTDPKVKVDHIDKNGWNCQKSNMRTCTHAENLRNNRSHKGSFSEYVGVSWCKRSNKWKARIKKDWVQYSCGSHLTELEAAKAYDEKAKILFGEFANLNFKEIKKPSEINQTA